MVLNDKSKIAQKYYITHNNVSLTKDMSKFILTYPVPPRMTKVCLGVSTENPKHWNNNDKRTRTIIDNIIITHSNLS
jgi:hypothetical protein